MLDEREREIQAFEIRASGKDGVYDSVAERCLAKLEGAQLRQLEVIGVAESCPELRDSRVCLGGGLVMICIEGCL